jgi:hypothetical protein
MSKPKTTRALVLVDLPQHGLKAGWLVDAEAPFIDALHKSGEVDPMPGAVTYAEGQGAKIVQRPQAVREAAADPATDFQDTQPAADASAELPADPPADPAAEPAKPARKRAR